MVLYVLASIVNYSIFFQVRYEGTRSYIITQRQMTDGLNSLKYDVMGREEYILFTHIKAVVGEYTYIQSCIQYYFDLFICYLVMSYSYIL